MIKLMMIAILVTIVGVCVNATAMLQRAGYVAVQTQQQNNASGNPTMAQQSPKTMPPQMQPSSSTYSMPTTPTAGSSISCSFCPLAFSIATNRNTNIVHGVSNSHIIPPSDNIEHCKSLTGTWGDVDPNIFYLCDMQTKKPQPIRCPEGKGYFRAVGKTGCIPYDQWPACVAATQLNQVHICDSDHMQQPWATANPNKFFICLQEAAGPVLLNCEPGKGFVHAGVGGEAAGAGDIVGCTNWEKWRSNMRCTDCY